MAQLLVPPGRPPSAGGASIWPAIGIEPGKLMGLAAAPTATPEPQPFISAPGTGEALQGVVAITGNTAVTGFQRVEIAFAFQSDPTGTWFLLHQNSSPVKDGTLANWDTATITDGVYRLRMQVFLRDGQVLERSLSGLRVRNYTIIETNTPEVLPAGKATQTPTSTPRADFQPAPADATPLPTNPAQLTPRQLRASALQGALAIFGAALLGALYLGLRALTRH